MTAQPLAGKHVVNTRAPHQAAELDTLLRARGAEPVDYPCIDIAPAEDTRPLDNALHAATRGAFDWLVLTSANTVLSLSRRMAALALGAAQLSDLRLAAVGPATAGAAQDHLGLTADVLPEEHVAEALAGALHAPPGARILLPQSDLARPVLAESLAAAGMAVTALTAYRTVIGSGGADVPGLLAAGRIDALTFTSASTVENFLARLAQSGAPPERLAGVCITCIGPVTAKAAQAHHLAVTVVPAEYTLAGLVDGLETYFMEAG